MKKILVALDYDPSAEKIAAAAMELAKAGNAEVTLLHVIADAVYYSSLEYSPVMGYTGFTTPDMVPALDVEQLRLSAKEFLEQSKTHLNDETIQTMIGEGDSADCIIDTAKHIGADVIVMGSHSRSGLDKVLMGSISEKVLQHTTIPLYIIPTKGLNK